MAKDFAFLFYINDWAGGTQWMSRLQRGAYLDLLIYQVNNTSFSHDELMTILGEDFEKVWPALKSKFILIDGKYFNEKMKSVIELRSQFTESRRNNRLGKTKKLKKNTSKSLVKLVEKENEIEKEDIKEDKKEKFYQSVDVFSGEFSKDLIEEFKGYWTELNKSKTKMRFQDEDYFDIKRRLTTFLKNSKIFNKNNGNNQKSNSNGFPANGRGEFGKWD